MVRTGSLMVLQTRRVDRSLSPIHAVEIEHLKAAESRTGSRGEAAHDQRTSARVLAYRCRAVQTGEGFATATRELAGICNAHKKLKSRSLEESTGMVAAHATAVATGSATAGPARGLDSAAGGGTDQEARPVVGR